MKGAFSEFLEVSKNSSGVLECSQLPVEITSFVEEAVMKCVLVWYYRYEPHSEPLQTEEFAWAGGFSWNSC